jgi:hypothetical protein
MALKDLSILERLVSDAVAAGMDTLEVEYKDGYEEVCALKDGVGYGIARFRSGSTEAASLRDELYTISRRTRFVTISGHDYAMRARVYDSFGEQAFRVALRCRERPRGSARRRRARV